MNQDKIKILCVATKSNGYYKILQESCKKYNYELITLGWGKKWQGFIWRHKLYYDYLKTIQTNEIIILSDAYDVVCLRDSQDLIKEFENYKTKILFGDQSSLTSHFSFNSLDKIRCCGNIIGYTNYLLKLEKWMANSNMENKFNNDDQMILKVISEKHSYFFEKYTKLDINQKIFFITNGDLLFSPYYNFYNDIGLKIKNTNNTNLEVVIKNNEDIKPCILHGAAAINLTPLLQDLGYQLKDMNKPNYLFKAQQFGSMLEYLIRINIIYQILLILIIVHLWNCSSVE